MNRNMRKEGKKATSDLLLDYLYDKSDSVSIHEALAEARKRWPGKK